MRKALFVLLVIVAYTAGVLCSIEVSLWWYERSAIAQLRGMFQ